MFLRMPVCCAVALFVVGLSVFAQNIAPAEEYKDNPKFQAAVKEGNAQLKRRQPWNAEDAFKKANKIAGGRSIETLSGLYTAFMMEGSYKDAVATATALETLATSPVVKSIAAANRGQALLRQGGEKPKPAQLDAAHAAFQAALTNYPKNLSALFSDGTVLARMGNNDAAREAFQKCATLCKPTDPARLRAMHFAENPELSLHKMAPAFEVTALDGSKFNLDAMGGRVVLIDFWATWCGPCNEELPHMKKIAKEFAGQPLVIISVSWDADEEKWKQFVNKNEMTWVQYRDSDHTLSDQFGIHAIPHYFTIDGDGVLTAEMMGSGSDVEGKLKKLLAKAKQVPSTAVAAGGGI